MRIRFAFDPFGPFCSWLMAVGAAFSLYCFIVCQAAADPAAWQHHGIYQPPLHHSTTPPLHHSITPILRCSITPLLRRSFMLYSRPMTTTTDELERSVTIYPGLVEVSALINSITDFNELLSAILDVAGPVMHS